MSATPNEIVIRAAFAPARSLEPTDAEVAAIVARAGAGRRRMRLPPPWSRPRRALVVAIAVVLLAAAAAGAASRLLPIGTELPPLSLVPGSGEPRYTSNGVVVGTGRLPTAGRWQATVTRSDQGQCLGFERPDSRDPAVQEVCGLTGLDAISVGGGDYLPNATIVFGPAPEEAVAVRVTGPGGFSLTSETHDGTHDMEGDFYVLEIPRKGLRNAEITWLDEHGRAPGPGLFVPSTITYGPGPKGPQRPH
jgi:hypothetical protein